MAATSFARTGFLRSAAVLCLTTTATRELSEILECSRIQGNAFKHLHFFGGEPAFFIALLRKRKRTVILLHDMLCLHEPLIQISILCRMNTGIKRIVPIRV